MTPLERARGSLEGLSVGDAFGQGYFVHPELAARMVQLRALATPPWRYTDDTEMALSVFACLREHGGIEPDFLARSFAEHYDVRRGYGPAMHPLLQGIRKGLPWRLMAAQLFDGQGSFGNGAAMRVAPVGAYFADDLEAAAHHAARSAEVTHTHPEGAAGAIAVSVAAALAWQTRAAAPQLAEFLDQVLAWVPRGLVYDGIRRAQCLAPGSPVRAAVAALGNGSGVSAQDTVPFCLWCAAQHLDCYEEALWLTVSGLGDRDTTCAIVGGILGCRLGPDAIPADWRAAREPLPEWPFGAGRGVLDA